MGRGAQEPGTTSTAARRPTAASTRLRKKAESLVPLLLEAGAEAVALFGSAARGEADAHSDLDLLAVFGGQPPRPSEIRKLLGRKGDGAEVSRATWSRFEDPQGQWSFFRMVGEEAVFLHDPDDRLEAALSSMPTPGPETMDKYSDRLSNHLSLYQRDDQLTWLNGDFFFLYVDAYRWSKVAIMEANMFGGEATHSRAEAFRRFGKRHPELADDLDWLQATEPFYLANMRKEGRASERPFSPKDTENEAWLSLCAAQEVIDTAVADMKATTSLA